MQAIVALLGGMNIPEIAAVWEVQRGGDREEPAPPTGSVRS